MSTQDIVASVFTIVASVAVVGIIKLISIYFHDTRGFGIDRLADICQYCDNIRIGSHYDTKRKKEERMKMKRKLNRHSICYDKD